MKYAYYINKDERGEFSADLRDENENTVWETEGFDVFEDGYMSHPSDLIGLENMLKDLGTIPKDSLIYEGN